MSDKRKSEEKESSQSRKKVTVQDIRYLEDTIKRQKSELDSFKKDSILLLTKDLHAKTVKQRKKIQEAFSDIDILAINPPKPSVFYPCEIKIKKDDRIFRLGLINFGGCPGVELIKEGTEQPTKTYDKDTDNVVCPGGAFGRRLWSSEFQVLGVKDDDRSISFFMYELYQLILCYITFNKEKSNMGEVQKWGETLIHCVI